VIDITGKKYLRLLGLDLVLLARREALGLWGLNQPSLLQDPVHCGLRDEPPFCVHQPGGYFPGTQGGMLQSIAHHLLPLVLPQLMPDLLGHWR
jgi:hypothetical protein